MIMIELQCLLPPPEAHTYHMQATAGRHIPAKAFTDVFVNVSATTAGFNRGGASSDGNVSQLSGIEATDTDGDLVGGY